MERDVKDVNFLIIIFPPVIHSNNSTDIVFSGKDANMIGQRASFSTQQNRDQDNKIVIKTTKS